MDDWGDMEIELEDMENELDAMEIEFVDMGHNPFSINVIVVESDNVSCGTLGKALRRYSLNHPNERIVVQEVCNAETALDMVAAVPPVIRYHCVIIGSTGPVMSSAQTVVALRNGGYTGSIYGMGWKEDELPIGVIGVDVARFYPKPYMFDEVAEEILFEIVGEYGQFEVDLV